MADFPTSDLRSPFSEAPSSADMVKEVLSAMRAMGELTEAAKLMDARAWALIEALTEVPGGFPVAVKIGRVATDVATLRIDGGAGSVPLEIQTGADGRYVVYADRFNEYGQPGRVIIDLEGRGV